MGRVLVGTSGFAYAHWRGVLYPPDLAQRRWLERYAAEFHTVELNATFYRLPRPGAVDGWRDGTPPGFTFAAKGSRYLTHMKRLRDPGPGLVRFLEPLARLGPKLAVILWQLPPRFGADPARLDAFLAALPGGVRHAVEFRDASWYAAPVCDVLDARGAAFCEHDLVDRSPPRLTGGFRYLRFHGSAGQGPRDRAAGPGGGDPGAAPRYAGRYGRARLRAVARDLARWAARGDAFVYFNNDLYGHAVQDARALRELLEAGAADRPGAPL